MSIPFVVHSHIPKTGGSALNRRFFFARFGQENVYQLYRYVFETASRLPRRHVARAMRSYAAAGHVPFGYFHELYPDAVYVSIFREPVSRFVSFLNFVLANPKHAMRTRLPAHLFDRAADDPDALIEAVLSEPRLAIVHSNAQTRLASGASRLGKLHIAEDHLRAALRNIDQPRYLTGLQEDLPGLLTRLHAEYPQKAGRTLTQNSSPILEKRLPRAFRVDDLNRRSIERITDSNALDLRLYASIAAAPSAGIARAA
ncbi:MAG: hypothetical protein AAGD13_24695 [Pseudomonadota bacterium]